jgi:hypothetical protein
VILNVTQKTTAQECRRTHEPLPTFNLTLGPEMKLMLALARPASGDEGEKGLKGLLASIDWPKFLKLCAWHGLFPLVHRNLGNLPAVTAAMPTEVTASLARGFRDNAIRMTGLGGEVVRLTGLLEKAGVRVLPWKGPVAALQIFGHISLRKSSDIDLLVAPEDLGRALAILQQSGYEALGYPASWPPEKLLRVTRHKHDLPLRNAARGVTVELHRRVSPLIGHSAMVFDLMWQDAEVVAWGGHAFRAPPREIAFLALSVHGAHHGWAQLRWLSDIAVLLTAKEPLDGERILREARKLRVTDIVLQALILAELFFDTPVPDWAEQSICRSRSAKKLARMAAAFITAPPESARAALFDRSFGISHPLYWAVNRYNMALCPTLPRKASNLLRSIAPSAETVEWMALPDSLFFLYYPLHLFFWFRRRVVKGL